MTQKFKVGIDAPGASVSGNRVTTVTDNLSAFAGTTSSQLLGIISDETGSGSLVFNTSPLFAGTVNLGSNVASGSIAYASNSASIGGIAASAVSYFASDNSLLLPGIVTEPAAPAAGNLKLYSKNIAGHLTLKVVGPSGLDTPIQNALWQNNMTMWTPTTTTTGLWVGTVGAGAGTYTTQLPTNTSLYTAMKRGRWANIATTTSQVLGQRNTEAMYFLGNAAGQGGFLFYSRLGFDVWTNGGRFFAGMHTGTTVISADPSALNNTVGFAVDAADNGSISFLTRASSTGTKASTGFTIVTGKGYDVYMFASTNSASIGWRIDDTNAGTTASGLATLTVPAVNTMLTAGVLASNAALTTVTSIQLGINRIYVEADR